MMTKKDFVALADALNRVMWVKESDPLTVTRCMVAVAKACEQANPAFQMDRFLAACTKDRP